MFWIGLPEVAPCAALLVADVLRLELVVGVVDAAGAVEPVGAALGHQVDADAAGLLRDVHAAGVDRHFLERVEVVVGRRRAGRVHVGDVDAVERPLVVERCCRRARCSSTAGPTCCRRCSRGPWRCPAVCCRMTHGSRADGMLCSCSSVKVCLVPVCLVSTIGLSPVTVTVSCTAETPSCVLTFALKPTVTSMPSLMTVLKPAQLELHVISADVEARELERSRSRSSSRSVAGAATGRSA